MPNRNHHGGTDLLQLALGDQRTNQLLVELNDRHYTGLDALVLQLPKRQLALSKATHEQRLVWEALCVLDEAQHQEQDQVIAHTLGQVTCDHFENPFEKIY